MAEDAPGVSEKSDPPNVTDTGSNESADTASSADSEEPATKAPPGQDLSFSDKLKRFLGVHWRGVVAALTPIICIFILIPLPAEKYQWCGYTLVVMAVYWVTECIPLPVTSFLPVVIFPLTGVMDTRKTCQCYVNDTVLMFLGSIMLAAAVEQSGFHKRLALCSIKLIGYSHYRLLLAVCIITAFISMWITNTAAATMMVPIVFAVLRQYEAQGLLNIYEKSPSGEETASKLTSCYFCAITFAATIGGIGTLVGTATNLAFKGLFAKAYPTAPEYLSFMKFMLFACPYMVTLNVAMYFYLIFVYMGFLRPNSEGAKSIQISAAGIEAAKKSVDTNLKALGSMTCHEWSLVVLFSGAIVLFFTRSPQIFKGWGDIIADIFELKDRKFVKDSAAATLVVFLMVLLPSTSMIFKNCTAKTYEQLPKGRIVSVINWHKMNDGLPYSFSYLLGGGFALSTAARKEYSDLNGKIGSALSALASLPNSLILLILIVFTVFITNFASNVAVCNVITPIAMQLAVQIKQNPLWYNIATGFSASYCFMLPVGTPGNLIVQSAAKVPTSHMIVAGFGPTISTILLTWFFVYFYGPIVWEDLKITEPKWAVETAA